MFTGIIESQARVVAIEEKDSNVDFSFVCPFTQELKVDQSVAHNGVCLTVTDIQGDVYKVTAIKETLDRSNLGDLKVEDKVNLERCTKIGGRLDGHIVQGHVDTTGVVKSIEEQDGSWLITIAYDPESGHVTIPKGSITLNGISLTVVDSVKESFSVAIIPFTYEHTNLHAAKVGDRLNLEFDVIGKYVQRLMDIRS